MASHPWNLILSIYLIIFMIGGGRVCGCESLSWVGIEVHQFNSGPTNCDHEHDGDHHHPEDQAPMGSNECCEEALVLFNADQPKKLGLPQSYIVNFEKAFVPHLSLNWEVGFNGGARYFLYFPPPEISSRLSCGLLIALQRFNL